MRNSSVKQRLEYTASERLSIGRPVDRLDYITEACKGLRVLDLGAMDETAIQSKAHSQWLHARIAEVAQAIVGVDNSSLIPTGGYDTGFSTIHRGDVYALSPDMMPDCEIIVAGEILEHVSDPVGFLAHIQSTFPASRLIATTPNATGLTNVLLAPFLRESMHKDHVAIFSYKSLNTIAVRAGYENFIVRPYRVDYPEALSRTDGLARTSIRALRASVNAVSILVPLWSNGFILDARPVEDD